jgi:hypothetical protein
MARIDVHILPTLSLWLSTQLGRRVRCAVREARLDQPWPLRPHVASAHRQMASAPSRAGTSSGDRDAESRRPVSPGLTLRGPQGQSARTLTLKVRRAILLFARHMQPGWQRILDDYPLAGDQPKAELDIPWVDRIVPSGAIIRDCVINSTGFGKLGAANSATYRHYSDGYARYFPAPPVELGLVRSCEDHHAPGPSGAVHDVVRNVGRGVRLIGASQLGTKSGSQPRTTPTPTRTGVTTKHIPDIVSVSVGGRTSRRSHAATRLEYCDTRSGLRAAEAETQQDMALS